MSAPQTAAQGMRGADLHSHCSVTIEQALFLQDIITQQQRNNKDRAFMEKHRRFSPTWKSFYSLPNIKCPGTHTVARPDPAAACICFIYSPWALLPHSPWNPWPFPVLVLASTINDLIKYAANQLQCYMWRSDTWQKQHWQTKSRNTSGILPLA